MNELLNKISSYNIFTNLLPGVLFCILAERLYSYQLLQEDLLTGIFLYYFIGLTISRIGSLVVEPILENLHLVEYPNYEDFLTASKSDPKIDILLETNNVYRSTLSLLLCIIMLGMVEWFIAGFPKVESYEECLLLVILVVIFVFAYKKQTRYIKNRVESQIISSQEDISRN